MVVVEPPQHLLTRKRNRRIIPPVGEGVFLIRVNLREETGTGSIGLANSVVRRDGRHRRREGSHPSICELRHRQVPSSALGHIDTRAVVVLQQNSLQVGHVPVKTSHQPTNLQISEHEVALDACRIGRVTALLPPVTTVVGRLCPNAQMISVAQTIQSVLPQPVPLSRLDSRTHHQRVYRSRLVWQELGAYTCTQQSWQNRSLQISEQKRQTLLQNKGRSRVLESCPVTQIT